MINFTKTLTLLTAMLLAVSVSTLAIAGPAEDAFKRKEYNEAYRQWSKNPETAPAKFGIGQILLEGLGGDKDTDKGLGSIKSAASQGYSPAIQYLAEYSAKVGNFTGAVAYLEQLQKKRPSAGRQSTLLDYLGRTTRQPYSSSSRYCSELTQLDKLGGDTSKRILSECSINGFQSTVLKADAARFLKNILSSAPSYNTLNKLLPEALLASSPAFDPELVLSSLEKLDESLSSEDTKRTISIESLTKDVCTNLPTGSKAQKLQQLSYCALVAVKGDRDVAALTAQMYLSGELGVQSASRALRFAQLSESSPTTDSIRLQAMESLGDWQGHLGLLGKHLSTDFMNEAQVQTAFKFQMSAIQSSDARYSRADFHKLAQLALNERVPFASAYEIIKAEANLPSQTGFSELGKNPELLKKTIEQLNQRFVGDQGMRFKMKQATIERDNSKLVASIFDLTSSANPLPRQEVISAVQTVVEISSSKQNVLSSQTAVLLGKVYLGVGSVEGESAEDETLRKAIGYEVLDMLKGSSKKNKTVGETAVTELDSLILDIENLITGRATTALIATASTSTVANTTQISNAGVETETNQSGTQVEPANISAVDKLKMRCNITNDRKICRDVGFRLMQRIELESLFNKSETREQALEFLKKAIEAGDIQSHRYVWDITSVGFLQDESDKKLSSDSLQTLNAKQDIGGKLRAQLQTIRTNPIDQLLTGLGSILTGDNKIKSACNAVRRLIGEDRLDIYDKGLALVALEGNTCTTRSD